MTTPASDQCQAAKSGQCRAATAKIADRICTAGLVYGAGFAVYYGGVLGGIVEPPVGLVTISMTIIATCVIIKAMYWIADSRAGQVEARQRHELAELRERYAADLGEVRDELRLLRQLIQAGEEDAQVTLARTGKFINERAEAVGSVSYLNRSGSTH